MTNSRADLEPKDKWREAAGTVCKCSPGHASWQPSACRLPLAERLPPTLAEADFRTLHAQPAPFYQLPEKVKGWPAKDSPTIPVVKETQHFCTVGKWHSGIGNRLCLLSPLLRQCCCYHDNLSELLLDLWLTSHAPAYHSERRTKQTVHSCSNWGRKREKPMPNFWAWIPITSEVACELTQIFPPNTSSWETIHSVQMPNFAPWEQDGNVKRLKTFLFWSGYLATGGRGRAGVLK